MLILLALAIAGWAWWTGRLRSLSYEDAIAGLLFLLGLRLLTTGRLLPGAALMACALLWAAYRRRRAARDRMRADDARRLLGVGAKAGLAEIDAAHRRLLERIGPGEGAGAAIHRAHVARDMLVAELNRRTPRAS